MKTALDTFDANVKQVHNLMNFDKGIMDIVLHHLQHLKEMLTRQGNVRPTQEVDKYITVFSNIQKNDSLRIHYETIVNQCVVLLVSYFATALEDVFKHCLLSSLDRDTPDTISAEKVTFSLAELKELDFNVAERIADIVATKDDMSFQDMKSVSRAFSSYFDFAPDRDSTLNNIIIGQAARHIIVHNGAKINARFTRQIRSAMPRTLLTDIPDHGKLNFARENVTLLAESMTVYLQTLSAGLRKYE